MARFLSIDDLNLEGKTVLLRVDINCPLNPETNVILDNNRIRMVLPTINKLTQSTGLEPARSGQVGKYDFPTGSNTNHQMHPAAEILVPKMRHQDVGLAPGVSWYWH